MAKDDKPAEAQATLITVPAPRYEYNVLRPWSGDTLEAQLNALGAAGWELVTMAGNYPVLKRMVDEGGD